MIDILKEWGKWSRHDYGSYSSPLYSLMKAHNPEFNTGDVGAPNITDDEAMRVSAIVCDLAKFNSVLAEVLKLKYIRDMSDNQIRRYYLTPLEYPQQASLPWKHKDKKKASKQAVKLMIQQAEDYVYRRL